LAYGTWVDNSSNEVRFDGYLDGNGPIPGSSGTPTPNREGFGYAVDGSATAVEAPIGTRFCTYIVAVDANQVTSTRSETVCATINASGEVLYG
jgi:hypothetical protein